MIRSGAALMSRNGKEEYNLWEKLSGEEGRGQQVFVTDLDRKERSSVQRVFGDRHRGRKRGGLGGEQIERSCVGA
jgi:hypothetical protein